MSVTPVTTPGGVPSFLPKSLRVTFTLGQGINQFPENGGANRLVLTNLRIVATVTGASNTLSRLDLQVYGMTQADMNALSVISGVQPFINSINKNNVLLEGNQGDGNWFTIFNGQIVEGGPEYRGVPEAFYHCQAVPAAYLPALQPATPFSCPPGTSIATIAGIIAANMGASVQTNGLTGVTTGSTYFSGSPTQQIDRLQDYSGIPPTFNYWMDQATITLVLLPNNQSISQSSSEQLVISPTTGLIGYPTIESMGIGIVCLFDSQLRLGASFVVKDSDVPAANGTWFPYEFTWQLESWKFGGQWFASMHCQQAPQQAAA